MSDSIGHIIKDSLGDQLTHSPSKSFVNRCETRLRLIAPMSRMLLILHCSFECSSRIDSRKIHGRF